jgi:putative transposase
MHIKRSKHTQNTYWLWFMLVIVLSRLSYRNTSKALTQFVKRSHAAVWKWIQRYKSKKIARKREIISGLMIDNTIVKIGSNYMWIWVAIELKSREILALNISKERNMLIAERERERERFISRLVQIHGRYPVSTDGGIWYPQAYRSLNVDHHIHPLWRKVL